MACAFAHGFLAAAAAAAVADMTRFSLRCCCLPIPSDSSRDAAASELALWYCHVRHRCCVRYTCFLELLHAVLGWYKVYCCLWVIIS